MSEWGWIIPAAGAAIAEPTPFGEVALGVAVVGYLIYKGIELVTGLVKLDTGTTPISVPDVVTQTPSIPDLLGIIRPLMPGFTPFIGIGHVDDVLSKFKFDIWTNWELLTVSLVNNVLAILPNVDVSYAISLLANMDFAPWDLGNLLLPVDIVVAPGVLAEILSKSICEPKFCFDVWSQQGGMVDDLIRSKIPNVLSWGLTAFLTSQFSFKAIELPE